MTERNKGKRLAKYVGDYVVFDLETTGISVAKDDIVEISAVRARGGAVTDTFSTLINPGRTIPADATAVNGITDEMVREAPGLKEALSGFLEFIGRDVLVGHNIHTFDLNFVYDAALALYGKKVDNDYIDTLYLAKRCLPGISSYKLTDLAAHFGVSAAGAHRALNDCVMNQKCYEELGKLLGGAGIELCPRCGGELVKRSGKFGVFFGCSNYPSCRYTKNA